jgi:hypothetical protein
MIHLIGISFLLSVLASTLAQDSDHRANRVGRDAIIFRNGDTLFGSLDSINQRDGIRWTRPDAAGEFLFIPTLVSEMALSYAPSAAGPLSSNLCSFQLSNGDQLQGVLNSYDGVKAVVGTWYGGTLEIPKASLALLVPLGLPKPVLYEGPSGVEGWIMGKVDGAGLLDSGQWHFHNNAFYALKSASIARDIHLPESASLQFDLEWRGFFHVALALYTEYMHPVHLQNKESEPKFGGFYSLQINPFSANLLPVKQFDPLRYLGQAPLQTLSQKSSARFEVRLSKPKRLIALLVDGIVIKQWIDTEEFAGTGTAIRIVHQGQGAVKLTNLKLTEWDGQFEETITVTPNKSQDLARLKNGDRILGNIKSIKDGMLAIEAASTILDVPLSRVKQIELAAAKAEPINAGPGTVRAHFASGTGSLTFELDEWSSERLTGTNSHLGALKLDPNAFSRLVFDLATPADPPK